MQVVSERFAGIDVHKKSVTVSLTTPGPRGGAKRETRTFGTTTRDLLHLLDWLVGAGCTHVAIGSTGVYWKPTYNILEGACEVVLANARDIKKFRAARRMCVTPSGLRTCSGTDSSGAALSLPSPSGTYATWCATAKALIREKASEINRLQKALEGMNIKLASVATNVLGMSGSAMLEAIAAGCTEPRRWPRWAVAGSATRSPNWRRRWRVVLTPPPLPARQQLRHIDRLDELIEACNVRIEEMMRPFEEKVALLCEITGVDKKTVQAIIAEIGVNMSRFPTDKHIASWAGVCPRTTRARARGNRADSERGARG